jgi:hypothetical protein
MLQSTFPSFIKPVTPKQFHGAVYESNDALAMECRVVVDVGFIDGRGWAVVEFNAAWGAGLNGCDPDKVLPAIVVASEPIWFSRRRTTLKCQTR